MNPVTYIRKSVFRCETQQAFAAALGTSQATVSRWETKGRIPGVMQSQIREKANAFGRWDDRWFFSPPKGKAQ